MKGVLEGRGLVLALLPCVAGMCWTSAQAQAPTSAHRQQFLHNLVAAAIERTHHQVTYNPGYVVIGYPAGDVPANSGVCSDEIVRAYRAVGIDLQKEVHEDIARNPSGYPLMSRWKQKLPDSNIDHRRVANLMVFFGHKGEQLPVTSRASDYQPGDLVAWDLGNRGAIHIGMVVDRRARSGRSMVVHNIGAGPKMEDVLFNWKIIGHYRYLGPAREATSTNRSQCPRRRGGRSVETGGGACAQTTISAIGEAYRRRSLQTLETCGKMEYKKEVHSSRSSVVR